MFLASLGGIITQKLNKEKPSQQFDALKTQNRDLKGELFELKKLNAKLIDKVEMLEAQLDKSPKNISQTKEYTFKRNVNTIPEPPIQTLRNLIKQQKKDTDSDITSKVLSKFKYTPQSVVRAVENKLKFEQEMAVSDLTDKYEAKLDELRDHLREAATTIYEQSNELRKYTDKTHNSIAQKFLHITRISQLQKKVDVTNKIFRHTEEK